MKQDGRSRSGRGQNGEIADKRVVVGRVQRQVRRAFVASNGRPLQIGDLLARCYPGTTDHPVWHRTNVHRALPKFAVSLGRTNAQGRPMMWAPSPELMRLVEAPKIAKRESQTKSGFALSQNGHTTNNCFPYDSLGRVRSARGGHHGEACCNLRASID